MLDYYTQHERNLNIKRLVIESLISSTHTSLENKLHEAWSTYELPIVVHITSVNFKGDSEFFFSIHFKNPSQFQCNSSSSEVAHFSSHQQRIGQYEMKKDG